MRKSLTRIFSLAGGVASALPWAYDAYDCICALIFQTTMVPNASIYGILAFDLLFICIAGAGIAGSLFFVRKPKVAGWLMLAPGVIILAYQMYWLVMWLEVYWFMAVPPCLLIVAGILTLIKPKQAVLPLKPESDETQAEV